MRVLIAGAAGFIGSHLTQRLLSRGHDVIGVDSFITGTRRNLAPFERHRRFEFLAHDVVEPVDVMGRLDWVLHFASPASPVKYQEHPIETLRCNSEGTQQLLELAAKKRAGFLLASTSEVYGDPLQHPQVETYWGHVNPVGPRSMYDEAKRYAEALATAWHARRRVPVRIVRIFNTYGPRMRHDDGRVVVNFIRQALAGAPITVYGDGSQTRSFQFVDDLLAGVERAMQIDYAGPINIGNPDEYSMLELASLVKRMTGSDSPLVHAPLPTDDPRQRRPDISLARRLLDWEPRVPLEAGLARTIDFVRATPEMPAEDEWIGAPREAPAADGAANGNGHANGHAAAHMPLVDRRDALRPMWGPVAGHGGEANA